MNQQIKLGKINCIFFSLLLCSTIYAQKPVTGQVFDSKGEPIVGASVHVKGTEIYSSTDLDGHYYLHDVISGSDIEVAYIGYPEKKIKYQGQDTINVALGNNERFKWGLTIGYMVKESSSQEDVNFMGGFVFEIPLKNRFFIVPELLFVDKNRIQVPIDLMKKIKLSNKVDLGLFSGLRTSYAWYEKFDNNYWNIGINLGFGFSGSHFFYKTQYHYILATQANYDVRNLGYVSIGYLF